MIRMIVVGTGGDVPAQVMGPRSRLPDFEHLLGSAAWRRLPEAVRQRFCPHAISAVTTYRGSMIVKASLPGRCIAQLCRLLGTPVAPFVGESVPVQVNVYDRPDGGGTVWERIYAFANRPPVVVRSTKQLDADASLLESLNAGLHMRLRVYEERGALHFVSEGYFFRIGRFTIPLPDWLPPGVTHVIHEDQGNGRFRFTMRTAHPWCGEMFFQSGIFE